jgi:hypothetical protein
VRRWLAVGAAAVLAFAAAAVAVVAWLSRDPAPVARAAPPAEPEEERPVVTRAAPTPVEIADPAEAARLEGLLEARERYRALRDGFGGPATAASYGRLAPAIRSVWPGADPWWVIDCRGRLCRVEVEGDLEERRAALDGSPLVRAVTEGPVVADPDGVQRPFFLVVASTAVPSGDRLLAEVADELAGSPEAQACLARAAGEVTYRLKLDTTGITYRTSGSLPWEVVDCVNAALTDLLVGVRRPRLVRQAERTVVLTAR